MSRTFGRLAAAAARAVTLPLERWRRAQALAHAAMILAPDWTVETARGRLTFAGPTGGPLQDPHGFGRDEPETVAWIDGMPDDAVFWDIGANVGVYSVYAGRRGLRVLAFEPWVSTHAVLIDNVARNGVGDQVQTFTIALAAKTGIDALYMEEGRREAGHALHSFGTPLTVLGTIRRGFRQTAIGFAIDDFIRQFAVPAPTHVKLDVDGIETDILQGGAVTLTEATREVIIEILDAENPAQAADIRRLMTGFGYRETPTGIAGARNKLFVRA